MSAAASRDAVPSLVDLLLAEQGRLFAVDEFSSWHDAGDAGDRHGGRFETLIPAARPGAGQQYAFAVDLDACTGCKACVTACHSLNGLEPGETWRKVGEVEGRFADGPLVGQDYRQTVTTACHHCADPGCLAGCPVKAYEKDPVTGIVVHLDDQCIGCRYCQLTCPYDVPQFSERLGIVRKCDMCHGRLAAGEAPACVQGCPNQAISIAIVDVERPAADAMLLPLAPGGMPRSALTGPATRYRSERPRPADLRAVESGPPRPAEAHEPLAIMLVLTQGAVGALLFDAALALSGALGLAAETVQAARRVTLGAAALFGFAGLAASVFHLGRPQWAFRAVLGLKTSWMSREILAFGAFAGALAFALATTAAARFGAALATAAAIGPLGEATAAELVASLARLDPLARAAALAAGAAGLFCSVQIYAVTGRSLWRFDRTALRFAGTALVLGAAVAAFAVAVAGFGGSRATAAVAEPGAAAALALGLALLVATVFAKLAAERGPLAHGAAGHDGAALARTRTLYDGALRFSLRRRRGLALIFGVGVPLLGLLLLAAGGSALGLRATGLLGVLGCLAGELVERSLFFRGEATRGMPGART